MKNIQSQSENSPLLQTALTYLDSTKEALSEVLWPTRCVLCDLPGTLLCDACKTKLSFIDFWHRCPRCGAPQGYIQCTECNPVILRQFGLKQPPFSTCVSALHFNESTARIVRCFKDQNEQRLGEVLASYMQDTLLPSWLSPHPPPITYVPSTKKALRARGFDQGELLAHHLAKRIDTTVISLFVRPSSKDQRTLSRQGRIVNMGNRFTLLAHAEIPPRVLLIDDVYTTGSTLYAASQTLKAHGCKEVLCATFARVW